MAGENLDVPLCPRRLENYMEHIVIIGNGIAGITVARNVRKQSDKRITVISAETDHFFSRTALMYIFMGHMTYQHTKPYEDWFWQKNRIELLRAYVERVDFSEKRLYFSQGEPLAYDKLILAVGSTPNKFGWSGQDLAGVQGLYSYQDLELLEENAQHAKQAVIVGGGLIGIELAEMLLSRNIKVTFLVREKAFWGNVLPKKESELISRHIREHHVDLRLGTELKEILPDANGRVNKVITSDGEEIPCQLVGLTAGVRPNIDFLKNSQLETDRGIKVNRFLETNIPDVFAVGDCAQFDVPPVGRRPIEQVWYTGKLQGEALANTLCGNRTKYEPSHWFNSAKFFDIEYQTYGWVHAQMQEDEADFYWEHADGKKALHFVFDKQTQQLKGVNTFGIRLRHEVFDQWFSEGQTITHALEYLKDANFDPEFFKKHEDEIVDKFNRENGTAIQPKGKSWKRILKAVMG